MIEYIRYDTRPSLRQRKCQKEMARTIDKVGCRKKRKKLPTCVEPEASTGIFSTSWQYPVPPKENDSRCGGCVDVDTFPTD